MRLRGKMFKLSLLTITLVVNVHFGFAYSLLGYKWAGEAYNYKINPIGVDNSVDYTSKSASIVSAAQVWTAVSTTQVGVNYQGTTTDTGWGVLNYQNTVTWVTNGWSGNVIGISTSWYSGDKKILDSDIKLNTSFANDSRLPALVTHEVGHSLGIGHTAEYGDSPTTDEYNAIMYYLLHTQHSLNEHDNCAVTAIYPKSGGGCTPTYAAGKFPIPCCGSTGVTVAFSNNSYAYDGNSHSVTVTTTPAGISHTVTYYDQFLNVIQNPKDAGTYSVRVDITQSGYESDGPFFGSLFINSKTLHVYATNTTVTYGDSEPIYQLTYSGFVSGENKSNLISEPYGYIDQTWPVNPGYYSIYCNYGVSQNYSFVYHSGTLTVNGLSVNSVSIGNNNYTYDGSSKSVSVTIDPGNVGYSLEYLKNSIPIYSPTDAGAYDVRVSITEPGYTQNIYNSSLTIQQATLNATAENKTITYGENEPEYTISYTGFVNGENISVIDVLPVATINGVGPLLPGFYPIYVTGGYDNNYSLSSHNGTLTVLERTVNSVDITNTNHVYTGTTRAVSVMTNPTGLAHSVTYYDANNQVVASPIDAGTYTAKVTITEPGYRQDIFQSLLVISKASLTAKVENVAIDYGQPKPAFAFTYTGFVNNETPAVIDALPIANITGNWPVLPGTYTIVASGGLDNNYQLALQNGILTVNSNGLVVITISNTTHTYDGTAKSATISTIPAGLQYSVVYKDTENNMTTSTINAGSYPFTVTITEPGFEPLTSVGELSINKAILDVNVVNEQIYYGEPEPLYKYSISGFMNNESGSVLTEQPNVSIGGVGPLLPGSYTIFVTGGQAQNYSFRHNNGALVVKPLVVQAIQITNNSVEYSGLPNLLKVETIPAGVNYTVTYFDQQLKPILPPVNAGYYKFKVTINEPGYEATSDSGQMVVEKKTLLAIAPGGTLRYGEMPSLIPDIEYQGFVNGESIEVIDLPAQLAIEGIWPLPVGVYDVNVLGAADDNYDFEYQKGILTIEKTTLKAKANSYEIKYGEQLPAISYSLNGFVANDNEMVIDTLPEIELVGVTELEPGKYTIAVTGAADDNYHFQYENGELSVKPIGTVEVGISETSHFYDGNPKAVLVETNPYGISYAVEYPELNASELPSAAGKYNVVVTVTERGYIAEKHTSELVINKAPLQVKARDAQVLYGDDEPEIAVDITGFVNGEGLNSIEVQPSASVGQIWPLAAGEYTIIPSGGESTNYSFEYHEGKLTVLPTRKIVVTAGENGFIKTDNENSISKSISMRIAEGNDSPAFMAVAETNYKFDKWDDGRTENPRKVVQVFSDYELKALFKLAVSADAMENRNIVLRSYPNPAMANNLIRVEVLMPQNAITNAELMVSDLTGRIICIIGKVQAINYLDGLAPGVYTIALRSDGKIIKYNRLLIR